MMLFASLGPAQILLLVQERDEGKKLTQILPAVRRTCCAIDGCALARKETV